jgi:hypothetical protein
VQAISNLCVQFFHPVSGQTEGLSSEKPDFFLHVVEHIAATGIAAHRLLGRVAEWWKDELRGKLVPLDDLLRMRFFMLFAEGVIPPPSDGLPSAFPLSYQQSPVKLRIH